MLVICVVVAFAVVVVVAVFCGVGSGVGERDRRGGDGFGFSGVFAGSPPAQVGAAATRSTAAPATLVTLQPGQTANALLRITEAQNYPAASCSATPTTSLQIYPPNQTTAISLPYTSTGCASTKVNLLTISVVQPGVGSGG